MKKVCVILVVLLLIVSSTTSFALVNSLDFNPSENIQPRYEDVCSGRTFHALVIKGSCKVIDQNKKTVFPLASLFKCAGCGMLFVCDGLPEVGGHIENYISGDLTLYQNTMGATMYMTSSKVRYATTMKGYRFFINEYDIPN